MSKVEYPLASMDFSAMLEVHRQHQQMMRECAEIMKPVFLTIQRIDLAQMARDLNEAIKPALESMRFVQSVVDSLREQNEALRSAYKALQPIQFPLVMAKQELVKIVEVEVVEPTMEKEGMVCLPRDAEMMDKHIAIETVERGGWLYFRRNETWHAERISHQLVKMIRVFRDQELYPDARARRATDIARKCSDAITIGSARRSLANAFNKLNQLCLEYNCKPLLVREAGGYRYNPGLKAG